MYTTYLCYRERFRKKLFYSTSIELQIFLLYLSFSFCMATFISILLIEKQISSFFVNNFNLSETPEISLNCIIYFLYCFNYSRVVFKSTKMFYINFTISNCCYQVRKNFNSFKFLQRLIFIRRIIMQFVSIQTYQLIIYKLHYNFYTILNYQTNFKNIK